MTLSLHRRIWLWSAGISLGLLFTFFFVADGSFRSTIRGGLEQNLSAGLTLALQVRQAQLDELILRTSNLAQDPRLKAAVDTRDPRTIAQLLEEARTVGGMDWATVLAADGTALARTPGAPPVDPSRAEALFSDALFYDTGDVWVTADGLLDVAASPILFGNAALGILITGRGVGRAAVAELEDYSRQQVAVLAAGRVVAGQATGDLAQTAMEVVGDATVEQFLVEGERFFGLAAPVLDATRTPVASLLVYRSLDAAMAPARRLRVTLLAVAAAALGLAFLLALMLARRITAPVERLLDDAQRLGAGDLDHPILPMRRDEIGSLAEGFDRMRTSLRDAQEELLHSARLSAVGQMSSSIVHDFGNPLAAIRMNAQLIEMDTTRDDDRLAAREIIKESDRMNAMMREVLEFARGERRIERLDTQVGDWIGEIGAFWTDALRRRGIGFRVESGYRGCWTFDAPRVRRVVDNLVKNAEGALTACGTITLRSSVHGERFRLEVEDDGPGIPAELRETLFQPFTTSGKKDGTGLGLAICKSIVDRHGGSLTFTSSPAGTIFTLDLPPSDAPCPLG